jgi:hypothetical protein
MAFVHPEHDSPAVTLNFVNWLRKDGWIITDTSITYSNFGNSVSGGCRFIVAIHQNTVRQENARNISWITSLFVDELK